MKIDKFKTYLEQSGATLLETTNPYELVRFKTENGVSVVYTGKRGVSFTGEAQEAYDRMLKKSPWTITSNGLKQKQKTLAEIIERDGHECFYCCKTTTDENRSIEHILSVSHGGNNNPSNLAMCCNSCNLAVGEMCIVEKIKYRDAARKHEGAQQ